MRRRRRIAVVVVAVISVVLVPSVASAQTVPPGYVTISFGRMQWVPTGGSACAPIPGSVDLGVVHDAMAARGIVGSGVVIPPRTPETGFRCFGGYTTHPGWDLLSAWHDEGWGFTSGGAHLDVATLTYEQTLAETCGWLPTFAAHGIDASGMFAYGNNTSTTAAQIDPTSRCFAYGRRYQTWSPNVRSQMAPPWFQQTQSVNGGRCNDASLPCYSFSSTSTRYQSPVRMADAMSAAPDTWTVLQFYRFVDGARTGASPSWDCTSTDWRRHWTSQTELYCYRDLLQVLDALGAAVATGGVQVADHLAVAAAWGRTLSPPAPGEPRTTTTTVACPDGAPTTCTVRVRDADDGVPAAPTGVASFSSDGPGTFTSSTCTLAGARPQTTCAVGYTPAAGATATQTITATYAGSAGYAASAGTAGYLPSIDRTPPSVQITNPPGSTVPKLTMAYLLAATASDPSGVEHVRFYLGTTLRCTDVAAPYTCAWNTPRRGQTFQLRVVARDRAGNEASVTRTVTTV